MGKRIASEQNGGEKPAFDRKIIRVVPPRVARMPERILVSVVMPVCNVGPYLQQALDTVRGQTLREIEIICVDDGSTDNSLEILERNAQEDARIRILRQENQYAGVARNNGLSIARGKYVSFLDPDDFFCLDMLQEMSGLLEKTGADVCVCPWYVFDHVSGKVTIHPNEHFDRVASDSGRVFSYADCAGEALQVFTGQAWNKLYARAFVEREHLRFQKTMNYNDFFFAYMSLIKAKSIVPLKKPFVYYRRNTGTSLQDVAHKSPYDYLTSLECLQLELRRAGAYETLRKSFVNFALELLVSQLERYKSSDLFPEIFDRTKNELFKQFDIEDKPESYFYPYVKNRYRQAQNIRRMTPTQYLAAEIECLQGQIGAMESSLTFRAAARVKALLRAVKR